MLQQLRKSLEDKFQDPIVRGINAALSNVEFGEVFTKSRVEQIEREFPQFRGAFQEQKGDTGYVDCLLDHRRKMDEIYDATPPSVRSSSEHTTFVKAMKHLDGFIYFAKIYYVRTAQEIEAVAAERGINISEVLHNKDYRYEAKRRVFRSLQGALRYWQVASQIAEESFAALGGIVNKLTSGEEQRILQEIQRFGHRLTKEVVDYQIRTLDFIYK